MAFFFLFLKSSKIFADLHQQEMRQAAVYVETGAFDRAIAIYDGLLDAGLESSKRAILQYDIGTVYLEKKKFDQAIREFNSIKLGQDPSPLLLSHIKWNLGLARYEQALQLMEGSSSKQDDDQIYDHLREALQAFSLAEKQECFLQSFVGAPACTTPLELQALQVQVKRQMAIFLEKSTKRRLLHLPLEDAAALFYYSLSDDLEDIDFLMERSTSPLFQKYLELLKLEQENWLPLSNALEQAVKTLSEKDRSKGEELVSIVKNQFEIIVSRTKQGKLEEAKAAIKTAQEALYALMNLTSQDTPLKRSLRQLIGMYGHILQRKNFKESSLRRLQEEQEKILKLLSSNKQNERSDNLLKIADEKLKNSIQDFKNFQKPVAIALLYEAAEFIKDALFEMEQVNPIRVLSKIIREQQYALQVNRSTLQLPQDSPILQQIALESQQRVVVSADSFFKAVYEEQRYKYDKEKICQAIPWAEALPLFEKGLAFAKQSIPLLQMKESMHRQAADLQQKAITEWNLSLMEIKTPKSSGKSPCSAKAFEKAPKENQAKETNSEASSNQNSENSQQNLLQSLQQMNLDDKLPRKKITSIRGDEKPW